MKTIRTSGPAATATAAAAAAVVLSGCGALSGGGAAPGTAPPGKGGPAAVSSSGQGASGQGAVAALLRVGIDQAGRRQWKPAETTFDDVLAVSPRNVYALYNLGLVDQRTGNAPGAASYYRQAISARSGYTPAMFNLAITEEDSSPAQAVSLYKKIVAINPRASTAYLRMAFVYARQGDASQARQARDRAVSIDSTLARYSLPARR